MKIENEHRVITTRINPANRLIDIRNPEYVSEWITELERVRTKLQAEIAQQVKEGKLTLQPIKEGAFAGMDPVEFTAHATAESHMQREALLKGIGLIGIQKAWDHGDEIVYIEDSEVPVGQYVIE